MGLNKRKQSRIRNSNHGYDDNIQLVARRVKHAIAIPIRLIKTVRRLNVRVRVVSETSFSRC